MKRKIIAAVAVFTLLTAFLAGCSQTPKEPASGEQTAAAETTQAETTQAETEPLSEELLSLSSFRLDEDEFVLPLSYGEFSEKTGFTFSNSLIEGFTEETKLPAYTTLNLNYMIGDGYLYVLLANQTDKEITAKDGEIIAVKFSRYQKETEATPFYYCGINWDSSYDEILELMGDSENIEKNRDYHMIGYSKKRDADSNISYSFIVDDEDLYSFALSVDNMNITYQALETETETTE